MIRYPYTDLVKRLADARSWATGVTEGNRCAFVVGVALNLKPANKADSFRSLQSGVSDAARNQPFLDKFYVKAKALSEHIRRAFGPPDVVTDGANALKAIRRRHGVLFMEGCWGSIRLFGIVAREAHYDHVDLWDGEQLEIYKGEHTVAQMHAFVQRSKRVQFWDVGR